MKVKYLIYFFTFTIMLSFAVFISDGLVEAHKSYLNSQENLYKISRAKEVSEAFQASLLAHQLKRLSLVNNIVTETQWQYADKQARKKIAIVKSHIDNEIPRQQSVGQKFAILSMVNLMEKLLDNDSRQLSHANEDNTNLFNLNSAYYIVQTTRTFYRYTYDTRLIDPESFLFLESIRLNNRLNMSLTELIDQIIDVNLNSLGRKDAYLKAIQLTGVLNSLGTRLAYMKLAYSDPQVSSLVNEMQKSISSDRIDEISDGLYLAITQNTGYNAQFIYQYIKTLSQLSQQLYQRSFELEIAASEAKMYDSLTAIYGMISLGGLITLFILLPSLIFCSNISRWLTKTHNNILRLSKGDMNIDSNEAFYSKELIAISDAINQLKQYNQVKLALENEKHQLIKELETSSFLDPLTNIYNRRKFFLECDLLATNSYPQAFCLIDIDNFKRLNDTYGHDVGDRVLVMFAELLRNTFRSSDIFCRYGGEEFALLLGHCTLENARGVMEELREQTHRLCLELINGKRVRFTVSCGIAAVASLEDLHPAIKQADEALYFCKKTGKDKVSIYTLTGFI
ncbi:diguanylate cyclase (GGDEF)-like protein [Serratia fonticola]|uniref:diguanylate cyclase n=1 Tax=Serratia fonticola TaxID=47917 RepID=A0A542BMZ4_SERFO|nr:GGDEF domain-containing protein [Serratia fonticola]TQI79954.1 diguanylate cyclase (GGDEF)-like protein [Serratia fonticola]TQI98020.1 diguanylate cyclase (GGDEF)-like protein [Serratia fonticola]TVZ72515.1 diguanylate cyclase (GGDEF)-like protein [Serratia fonticola]